MAVETKRVHDLAKEYKVSSHAMLKIVRDLGYEVKSHMSVALPEVVNVLKSRGSSANTASAPDAPRTQP